MHSYHLLNAVQRSRQFLVLDIECYIDKAKIYFIISANLVKRLKQS